MQMLAGMYSISIWYMDNVHENVNVKNRDRRNLISFSSNAIINLGIKFLSISRININFNKMSFKYKVVSNILNKNERDYLKKNYRRLKPKLAKPN